MTYITSLLSRTVRIHISMVGSQIMDTLLQTLKEFEGKCVAEGYLKRNSIQIINYSCGIMKAQFVMITVVFECKIANPTINQELECVVENNTKAGIKCKLHEQESPFIIFIARDHHSEVEGIDDIQPMAIIKAQVVGHRYEVNDPQISIIAKWVP
jgi:DNA-directed RNA polymerase subunit E'/Rpb7